MKNSEIGSFFRLARNNRNMTQKEIGEKLGYTSQNISLWEFGKSCPKIEIVLRFCQVMKYDFTYFIKGILMEGKLYFHFDSQFSLGKINEEIHRKKISKKYLEYKLEVSRPTLNRILTGEISPTYYQFLCLLEALKASPEAILLPLEK